MLEQHLGARGLRSCQSGSDYFNLKLLLFVIKNIETNFIMCAFGRLTLCLNMSSMFSQNYQSNYHVYSQDRYRVCFIMLLCVCVCQGIMFFFVNLLVLWLVNTFVGLSGSLQRIRGV